MKRLAPAVVLCLTLTGCYKVMDYFHDHDAAIKPPCRIIGSTVDGWDSTHPFLIEYSYDEEGNPDFISSSEEYGYSEDFEYDSLGRLAVHTPSNYFGDTRKYVYPGTSKTPSGDTAIDLWGRVYIERFKQDYRGRIIRQERIMIYSPPDFMDSSLFVPEVRSYFYDPNGNRQVASDDVSGGYNTEYSDKPNLHSLHHVWQLVNRDYSRNSPPGGKTFNEYGLPLDFVASHTTISYECDYPAD